MNLNDAILLFFGLGIMSVLVWLMTGRSPILWLAIILIGVDAGLRCAWGTMLLSVETFLLRWPDAFAESRAAISRESPTRSMERISTNGPQLSCDNSLRYRDPIL